MNTRLLSELSLSFSAPDRGAEKSIVAAFKNAGIRRDLLARIVDERSIRFSYYTASEKEAALLRKTLPKHVPAGVKATLRQLRSGDWQTKWKEGFRPFHITKDIRIVPYWCRKETRRTKEDILIDTSLAFGTGLHATTQAVAGFLEERREEFRDFLDIGTGTGVLALVAGRCGAGELWGVDISNDAVATARRNFRLNRQKHAVMEAADFNDWELPHAFDFVAANLLAPVLLGLREKITAAVRPGKYLAVSGIWHTDFGHFSRRFESDGLERLRVRRRRGWVSVLYRTVNG